MEEKKISFLAHESSLSRLERIQKRLWIVALMLILLLVGSNTAWIVHFFV